MNFYYSETLLIDKYPGIHLLQDHIGTNYSVPWDDFGYIITFKVYFVREIDKIKIGNIKMLSKANENTSIYFKSYGQEIEPKITSIDNILSENKLVSIGEDIDYYKKINSLFKPDKIDTLLESLCDASYFHINHSDYSEWDGYSGSLMRGSSSAAILKKGYQIAVGRYNPTTKFELNIESLGDSFDPINFKFDLDRKVGKSNICLLIGKNGVGKTHILKKISEVITGVTDGEEHPPYFHKLIVIAYSPFEEFYTENEIFDKLTAKYSRQGSSVNKKSLKRKRLHVNEYSYIGFRNQEGDFNPNYPVIKSVESFIKILSYDEDNYWWTEKTRFQLLKETLSNSIEFDSISILDNDENEIFINEKTKINAIKESINLNRGLVFKKDGVIVPLSSGQKIYTYMIPAIISELEDESLLILDEPELYLHPELEVGLINMLKYILDETKSFSIIATHSSILTREVGRSAVTILRKIEGNTKVFRSSIETYGESIDVIISEVFDDEYVSKPYQKEIDKYFIQNSSSVSEIKGYIGNDALAYALSKSDDEKLSVEDE
ncbi:ATP-binding protein [Citrobacter portucalensis]|uniref:AAA family ATPase n=1 Tax=Citrobacter portucalensis TaxID=1639133 RepID=UPI00226B8FA9|nr:AAA family ATPase [Citrobacter portucalensis]MCX9009430.1 ATP-binding protein [Citrobacter portucalensis]